MMRTTSVAALFAGVMMADAAVAQSTLDQSDALIRACLLTVQVVDLGQKSNLEWEREHRSVRISYKGHDGSSRYHECNFLSVDTSVPELESSVTEKGNGPRPDLELEGQNAMIWSCFVTDPNGQFCGETSTAITN